MKKKRKFINPDDEDDAIEWVEAPKKQNSLVIEEKEIKDEDQLSSFLNKISSKSNAEVREQKKNEKEEYEQTLYNNRLYQTKASTSNNKTDYDINWLKKSYHRCLEQSKNDNVHVTELLLQRYDEQTVQFMLDKFENRKFKRNLTYFSTNSDKNIKCDKESDNTKFEKRSGENIKCDKESDNNESEKRFVTNEDLNEASAALFRAEISKDPVKIAKMKKNIETLREAKSRNLKIKLTRKNKKQSTPEKHKETVSKSLKSGKFVPYLEQGSLFQSTKNVKDMKKLEDMYDGDDMDYEYSRISSKLRKLNEEDCDYEYNNSCKDPGDKKEKEKAIQQHKKIQRCIKDCDLCSEKLPKHLILTKGEYFCIIVPPEGSLISMHCSIITRDHIASAARLDEEVIEELIRFKCCISKFHLAEVDSDTVYMEAVGPLDKYPHCRIDCVPIPRTGQDVCTSLYFRKSIQEAKSDWCINKGLLELKKGGIKRTVPSEMQYFCVEFSPDKDTDGFAFVVEKAHKFSSDFGLMICADLLGVDPMLMKQRQRRRSPDLSEQAKSVLVIEKKWKKYGMELEREDSDSE